MSKSAYTMNASAAALAPRLLGDTIARAVARIGAACRAYARERARDRRARESVRQLMALTDLQLRDIGLARAEIMSGVYGPAEEPRLDIRLHD